MGLKAGCILLRQDQDDKLTLASHLGLPQEFLREEAEGHPCDCIGFHVIQRKETLISEDVLESKSPDLGLHALTLVLKLPGIFP
jgi:hypothetical protein